jgi:hypothetical protein
VGSFLKKEAYGSKKLDCQSKEQVRIDGYPDEENSITN